MKTEFTQKILKLAKELIKTLDDFAAGNWDVCDTNSSASLMCLEDLDKAERLARQIKYAAIEEEKDDKENKLEGGTNA